MEEIADLELVLGMTILENGQKRLGKAGDSLNQIVAIEEQKNEFMRRRENKVYERAEFLLVEIFYRKAG
jgi:hypothetical protein